MFFNIEIVNKALDIYFKRYSNIDLAKSSMLFAIATSLFLVFLKGVALFITSSISMQASLNDSCLDAFASFAAFYALKISSLKNDVSHNFGHEKVEGIAAVFQCLLVTYSGYIICKDAYELFFASKIRCKHKHWNCFDDNIVRRCISTCLFSKICRI